MDPRTVFRCEHCNGVLLHEDIEKGGCQECGGRRVRIAYKLTDEEAGALKARGYIFDDDQWSPEPTL